jgi:hypothetical protein
MSMSEFERQENTEGRGFSPFSIQHPGAPDDFSEEDLAFAAELNALFSPEEENLPPYYVQTLLDADDQRFEPVSREFEHKTSANVFRRLKLRRRLFYTHTSTLRTLSMGIGDSSVRRSALAIVSSFALILLLTVAFTGASFVSGIAILLHNTHGSGVYQTNTYPVGKVEPSLVNSQNMVSSTKQISFPQAQGQMLFQMYGPGHMVPGYSLAHINLYAGLDQQWADGPMLEFEFSLPPSAVGNGTGEIWVREFKPRANVLQLVEKGASIPIAMDNSGTAMAIYVDGEWNLRGRNDPQWVSGGRSELIYQANGVVFWIVGDQRNGIGQQELMQVAQGLVPMPANQEFRILGETVPVTQMHEDVPGPFSADVIVVYPANGANGPYYIRVSSYQPKNDQ